MTTTNMQSLPDVLGRQPSNGLSVLISGSGIGGLTAARELWRIGCSVRVLERQPEPINTGDSFSIGPSALTSLSNYPSLERQIDEESWEPVMYMRKINGQLIKGPVERNSMLSDAAKGSMRRNLCRHSRPLMYQAMLSHLQRTGIQIEHGMDVIDYFDSEFEGRAGVVLHDGSRIDADLVIAADGVHGSSWRLIQGREVPARPSGDAVFRVSFPLDIARKDPMIAAEYPVKDGSRPAVNLYAGEEVQFAIASTPDDMSWSIMHKDDGRARELWNHHPPVANALQWVQKCPDVPEIVTRVIKATPPERLVDFRIMWRDPERKWTTASGRVIQIGDAAHTFHPSSGNGGTQAMEDAVSLAACVAIAGKDNVGWAARVSNELRYERVSCLQAFGIYNQANKRKGGHANELGRWIVGHDPHTYAVENYEEALRRLQEGTPFTSTNIPPGMIYRSWTIDTLMAQKEKGEPTVLDGDWS